MYKKRKVYSSKEKFQIVLELIKGRKTQSQITSEFWVHPTQQNKRKEEFMEHWETIFTKENDSFKEEHQKEIEKLHKIIGQHAVEVDWLKKKIGSV